MSLWDRRHTLVIDHLSSYLATAAKFSVFKYLLREKKRSQLMAENALPGTSEPVEELINARFMQDYINGIVETLPPQCRLVFRYSREGGMTIPEIAERMAVSSKTVESHLTRALKVLRGYLKAIRLWQILPLTLTLFTF